MRLQFSLATLLLFVTVVAAVTAACVAVPVYDTGWIKPFLLPEIEEFASYRQLPQPKSVEIGVAPRRPKSSEILCRIAIYWPITLGSLAAMLWIVQRKKSEREISGTREISV
jgi:hypothetical protein